MADEQFYMCGEEPPQAQPTKMKQVASECSELLDPMTGGESYFCGPAALEKNLASVCSPVPRKRGASIFDETAEYMRIHQALSAGKRVSFADTTGGDLVDVREFAAFDSDEEDSAKWQEEEAKYRKAEREPTYRVHPEFHVPSDGVLLQAVRSNKVEVERISPLEDEPLAFSGVIRVLNISFHKAVYIRSTMDSWGTYFDHPAEYVLGSNVDDTDQFSFKLSFAPPYTTHGSRIEFVVRYETSVGDYWANNFSRNYAVTLLLSYEDNSAQSSIDMTQKRSILKSPKVYSLTSEEDQEKGEEEPESLKTELVRPAAECPVIIHPEIDVEKPVHQSSASAASQQRPLSPSTPPSKPAAPSATSKPDLQSNSADALEPDKSEPLHLLHQKHEKETPEQLMQSRPAALSSPIRPSFQEPEQISDESQAEREEILLCFSPLSPAAGDKSMAAECVSYLNQLDEVNVERIHLRERFLEMSAARRPAVETRPFVEAEDGGRPSAKAAEPSQDAAPPSASFDDPLGLMSGEEDYSIDLIPCLIFMGVSLSLMWWKLFSRR
ncbi:protein phosphatase 1 regulatory subunit 3A isoform X2 [Poeciliopsis prolifica]|uniref:protein phosphatase 1 regulatory subunit 3A isoform X2 n=2 Tax=Poeciliopsis prolifica TaxID=188132 RepID=UPI00241313F6|nr:protein phosphatase 1 regulatory subunit 3A isoform X2 [Poeciliopsis prolifica]